MKMLKQTFITLLGATALTLGTAQAASMPGHGHTVRPAEGTNLEEKFQHMVLYQALRDLGYKVADPTESSYQTLHLSVGQGDADFTAVHWDPLHAAFFKEAGGDTKLEKVGSLISGALQGYLVDTESYNAGVRNLGDLKNPKVAKRFDADGDGKADLAGCVPGWGCERVITHQLKEFGLGKTVNHNQGEYAVIISETIARAKTNKPIIYYTWTPYWVSGVLVPGKNVQWIEVPYSSLPDGRKATTKFNGKELGFEGNNIIVVANKKFLAKNPAAKKLFEIAKIDINDVSEQNGKIKNGEKKIKDIKRHVRQWITKNRGTYDSWLKAARKAAQ